jgi:signal transduction histidine kinase
VKRFRSIISRVVALHILALGATFVLLLAIPYWLLSNAANDLHRDVLRGQALAIGSFLHASQDGGVVFDIPPELRPLYSSGYGLYAYAVLDASGRVLFSSRADGTALFPASGDVTPEWLSRRPATGSTVSGVTITRDVGGRVYRIQVGQDLAHRDVIIDDIVTSYVPRVAWIALPILLLLLLIDILIFRNVLRPVREASTMAMSIGPARPDLRLPEAGMPTEVVPLAQAVNQALERLEAGLRAQRDFTADTAHELRTALAIVRARVDSMEPGTVRDSVRADIVNMTRTVNQVLDIAELESFVVSGDAKADLHAVCAEAVAFMAPLAVDSAKTIALTGADGPVWVHGHTEALFRAVRNLVENAIRHAPTGGSIEVEVSPNGTVRVLDDGPGVPEAEHETIFRRFWRRDRAKADSRGLGLAIVARVAAAHDGSVTVENRPDGGAIFTLRLHAA